MSPCVDPPSGYIGTPHIFPLEKGKLLTRIHNFENAPTDFNPTIAPLQNDLAHNVGRFDATENDPYEYLYAADRDKTAVSEGKLYRSLQVRAV